MELQSSIFDSDFPMESCTIQRFIGVPPMTSWGTPQSSSTEGTGEHRVSFRGDKTGVYWWYWWQEGRHFGHSMDWFSRENFNRKAP